MAQCDLEISRLRELNYAVVRFVFACWAMPVVVAANAYRQIDEALERGSRR